MRRNRILAGAGLLAAFAAAGAVIGATESAGQTAAPRASQQSQSQPSQQQAQRQSQRQSQSQPSPATTNVLKTQTRVVTLDVVATDSHGDIVRDLKADDFELSDRGPQSIEKFSFIDKSQQTGRVGAAAATPVAVKGFYTNQPPTSGLAAPPTIILLDSLNSTSTDMLEARRHMLALLKTLPPDTPIAVMLLGQSLQEVQSFTSDPALLRAAVDRALKPGPGPEAQPEDDPNSLSLLMFDANGGSESDVSMMVETFEKETYAEQTDTRVQTTLDALKGIAQYLAPYPGRKNLVWLSESFPLLLWPDLDFGDTTGQYRTDLQTTRSYSGEMENASNALSDAQVAVYPVDLRGLQTSQVLQASTVNSSRSRSAARSMGAQMRRETQTRLSSQQSMDALAEGSGGTACKNTNDLSGCVEAALKDSSSYYELAYEPQNVRWDGSFHTISLKVRRGGIRLAYRRGYFAQDSGAVAASQPPAKRLQQACEQYLPSTEITISAKAVAPIGSNGARYYVTVAPGGLGVTPGEESYRVSAEMANCGYKPGGGSFQFSSRDISQALSSAGYQQLQEKGYGGYVDVPETGATRMRVAILDNTSGEIGAIDLPTRPKDIFDASTTMALQQKTVPDVTGTTIAFGMASGQSGTLDWSGDRLMYAGDLTANQAAPAFFQRFYHNEGFACDAGALVGNDATAGQTPVFELTFRKASGESTIVDMKGSQPAYSGSLPVDESAKIFFARLWYMMHCQGAPKTTP